MGDPNELLEDAPELKGKFVDRQERLDVRIKVVGGLTNSFTHLAKTSRPSRIKADPPPSPQSARLLNQTAAAIGTQLDGIREEVALAGGLDTNYKDGHDRLLEILRKIPPELRAQFGLTMPDVDVETPIPGRAEAKVN